MKKLPIVRWFDDLKSALSIYIAGNVAPTGGVTAGKFYFWNGKVRFPTSNISAGETLTDSNMPAVPEGGLNKVNEKVGDLAQLQVTANNLVGAVNSVRGDLPAYQRIPLSPSSKIASTNSFDLYKYGSVYAAIMDFTIGATAPGIYEMIATHSGPMPAHTVVIAGAIRDLTADTMMYGGITISYANGVVNSYGTQFTANHRYSITGCSV